MRRVFSAKQFRAFDVLFMAAPSRDGFVCGSRDLPTGVGRARESRRDGVHAAHSSRPALITADPA